MIRTIDGKLMRSAKEVEVAGIFEDLSTPYGVASALQKTLDAKAKPASVPTLLQWRTECDNKKDPIFKWYTGMSELDVVGNNVYLTHGGLYLRDPARIRRALKEGLVNYAAKLTDEESAKLTSGQTGVRIVDFDEFLAESERADLIEPYTIKADRRRFNELSNERMATSDWARDPRAIIYAGSKKRAEAYAAKLSGLGIKNPYLSIDKAIDAPDRSRLVFVGYYDFFGNGYGVGGDDCLDGSGRFAGEAPEAQVAQNLEDKVTRNVDGSIVVDGVRYVAASK